MRKRKKTWAHELRRADSFAESARNAVINEEPGRAIQNYEYALNYQINAINLAAGNDDIESQEVVKMYMLAIRYALECGRRLKARNLVNDALRLEVSESERFTLEELEAHAK